MLILAVDTAGQSTSACVVDAEDTLALFHAEGAAGHADRVVHLCEEVIGEAGIAWSELSHVGACVGPGSFAGLRAGVAAVRGFGLSLDIPALGATALECVAMAASARLREADGRSRDDIAVAIAGPRSTYFLQAFDADVRAKDEARACALPDLASAFPGPLPSVAGSGAEALAEATGRATGPVLSLRHDARDVASVIRSHVLRGDARVAEPFYLRGANAAPARPALERAMS